MKKLLVFIDLLIFLCCLSLLLIVFRGGYSFEILSLKISVRTVNRPVYFLCILLLLRYSYIYKGYLVFSGRVIVSRLGGKVKEVISFLRDITIQDIKLSLKIIICFTIILMISIYLVDRFIINIFPYPEITYPPAIAWAKMSEHPLSSKDNLGYRIMAPILGYIFSVKVENWYCFITSFLAPTLLCIYLYIYYYTESLTLASLSVLTFSLCPVIWYCFFNGLMGNFDPVFYLFLVLAFTVNRRYLRILLFIFTLLSHDRGIFLFIPCILMNFPLYKGRRYLNFLVDILLVIVPYGLIRLYLTHTNNPEYNILFYYHELIYGKRCADMPLRNVFFKGLWYSLKYVWFLPAIYLLLAILKGTKRHCFNILVIILIILFSASTSLFGVDTSRMIGMVFISGILSIVFIYKILGEDNLCKKYIYLIISILLILINILNLVTGQWYIAQNGMIRITP